MVETMMALNIEVADDELDGRLLNMEEPKEKMQSVGHKMFDEIPSSAGQSSGASFSECEVEGQNLTCNIDDFENGTLNAQNLCTFGVVDTIEDEVQSNRREEDSFLLESRWLEKDEALAVWVKWRGKWQAGIRCARADWPLSTIKARPTHERKEYVVVFFPRTRNYSWADVLLVRPICELPHPIAYRTHDVGIKMVKNLTITRRFIMQKLAVSMLNIIDHLQLHVEALSEPSRSVIVWKEFAAEASHCKSYSDLGRMLLKLQNMVSRQYLNHNWLQHSLKSWVSQCQNADSAESIELLREELDNSIQWNEVQALPDVQVQNEMGSEWRTWKHEAMKWFSMSHPISTDVDVERPSNDRPSSITTPQNSWKRPKLEVRRAETQASFVKNGSNQVLTVGIDSKFFDDRDTSNNRWGEVIVEAENSGVLKSKDVELTPLNGVVHKNPSNNGNRSNQCIAFIEAKGRQCVRWANDGDVYCCVHLASRFASNSSKSQKVIAVDAPLCGGTTTNGTQCKHRSLVGSLFCKKHGPQGPQRSIKTTSNMLENRIKRKREKNASKSESAGIICVREVETPLQAEPISVLEGESVSGKSSLIEKPDYSSRSSDSPKTSRCIGSEENDACLESPKRHSLYCEKHLPSWLKRARNGKSRIISKEVFLDLLNDCSSMGQKLQLHQACEIFYRLFKTIMSPRDPTPKEIQLQWAISEASKDLSVGKLLMKLVCCEKDRLENLWGFNVDKDIKIPPSIMEDPVPVPSAALDIPNTIRCKICSEEFSNDELLGTHWMENHKKEAQWFFRGYACAICLDSFTNKKVLESHVQERHHVEFVENCVLIQCIPCGSHFGNIEQLWLHVLAIHPSDLRPSKVAENHTLSVDDNSLSKLDLDTSATIPNNSGGGFRKFICRFCGLKFDLLPDLGRHHQAAHMGPNKIGPQPHKRRIRYYSYKLKSGRLRQPRLKKGLAAASYRIRNRAAATMKKRIQASNLLGIERNSVQSHKTKGTSLGRLSESQCSDVATILFPEIQETKPRPSNHEILSIARSACCKAHLQTLLEVKYGVLPERLLLKAAKLCSEHDIQVKWHQEGFTCPKGCKPVSYQHVFTPLLPRSNDFVGPISALSLEPVDNGLELDECHYVIDSRHFGQNLVQKFVILCSDISFGKESVPILCVVDKDLMDSHIVLSGGQVTESSMPWENFTYVLKSLLDQSIDVDSKMQSLQLGCACGHSSCSPEACEHVYLFDNDYEDARDIYGKPMLGRFPYDNQGRLVLEEGYLVYECNNLCSCSQTCQNRVLQNGVRVKLEVFKTEKKGWALRAGEAIPRGSFVCEYIGEVLSEHEANERRNRFRNFSNDRLSFILDLTTKVLLNFLCVSRYGVDYCGYLYDIDDHNNDISRFIEGQVPYVIDATKYGNVSRFINHSCSPNLVNHQVLVESMESHLAHVGFYTNRDVAFGEELTYDYQYKMLPGNGYPCHCGASKCRGRLH